MQQEISVFAKDNYLNTPRFKLLIPEIIVLTRYNAVPPRRVKFSRRNIFERDRYTCQYCRRSPVRSELSVDHVVPRSRGGETSWENVVASCVKCNTKKGGRTPQEARMDLQTKPRKPAQNPMLTLKLDNPKYESWKTFLPKGSWLMDVG